MAVYKLFPVKDATIYSEFPVKNTGIDEILELDLSLNQNNPTSTSGSFNNEVSRYLLQFSQEEMLDIFNTYINIPSLPHYSANLKLYLAESSNIPIDYTLECWAIYGSWNMGTGRYDNYPETTDGVSWKYRSYSGSNAWLTSSYLSGITGSYLSNSIFSKAGGGNWFYQDYFSSASFNYTTNKDINFDVTSLYNGWIKDKPVNSGCIIKNTIENEFNNNVKFNLKYFSMDTHTIFPPELEIKWEDYDFSTGSSALSFISDLNPVVTLANNKGEFKQSSIQKFRIYSRDKFPNRVFQTSSIYLSNKILPTSSYYSVIDYKTGTTVIDFDNIFTRISTDSTSSYFTLYMNGLQPERYYKVLIKSVFNGNELIFDDEYYFKVIT